MSRTYLIFRTDPDLDPRRWEEYATVEASNPDTAIRKARTALEIPEGYGVAAVPDRNWTAVLPELVVRKPVLKLNDLPFGGEPIQGQMTVEEVLEADSAAEAQEEAELIAEAEAELAAAGEETL